jgi:sulfite reductase beta subunit-like hemoprotein
VRAEEVPAVVEKALNVYEAKKRPGESFASWSRRHSVKELQEMFS